MISRDSSNGCPEHSLGAEVHCERCQPSADRRLNGTVRQVIQNYRTGVLEVAEVPAPVVRLGRVLIRTAASVVSAGTERHLVEMGQKSLLGKALARPDLVRRALDKLRTDGVAETFQQVRQRLDTPVPLGYSAAGTVIAVGEGVSGFEVGKGVACGGQGVAVHAETLCAPPTLVAPLPPGVPMKAGAFAMVGAISLHAVRLCQVQPGEWVAVIGLGLLGLLAVQMLRVVDSCGRVLPCRKGPTA